MSIAVGGITTVLDTDNYALFQNIDSSFPASSAVPYTVRAGETLQSIADLVYGDRSLWYLIAAANGLTGNEALATGRILTIPARSQTGAINGDTHTVYSQDEVVGSTLPNLKSAPPSGHGCSGLLQVLVVVTVYTAGLASGALAEGAAAGGSAAAGGAAATAVTAGEAATVATATSAAGTWSTGLAVVSGGAGFSTTTLVAAGIGGAAGSILSQGVAIATGLQNSFSWRGVAEGFVGAVATAGVGAYAQSAVAVHGVATNALPGASLLNDTGIYGRVALSNATTQGLSVAAHLQDKFSWRSVGATAVAAGVGTQANNALGNLAVPGLADAMQGTVLADPYAASVVRQTIVGTASAVVQQKLATGHVDLGNAALGAFGGALQSGSTESKATAQDGLVSDALAASSQASTFQQDHLNRLAANSFGVTSSSTGNDLSGGIDSASAVTAIAAVENSYRDAMPAGLQSVEYANTFAQLQANTQRSVVNTGESYSYATVGVADDGSSVVTIHGHRGLDAVIDDGLSDAQDGVMRVLTAIDENASQSGATTGTQVLAAATYAPRKILADSINGMIGLPRLATSDTIVPGMVNAAAHPLQTAKSIVESVGAMSIQDKLVTGLEIVSPFKGDIESLAGKIPKVEGYLAGDLGYSSQGVTLSANGKVYGFIGDGSIIRRLGH